MKSRRLPLEFHGWDQRIASTSAASSSCRQRAWYSSKGSSAQVRSAVNEYTNTYCRYIPSLLRFSHWTALEPQMGRKHAFSPERKFARVFMTGGSQAVRLPQEFRFETDRVAIRREGANVILSPPYKDWADYFARAPKAGEDFVAAIEERRRDLLPLEEREPFD